MKNCKYLSLAALALIACGEDSSGPSLGGGSTAALLDVLEDQPCVVTFTETYDVLDWFDEKLFTANSGDEFVLRQGPDSFGPEVDLYKVVDGGIIDFEVGQNEAGEYPFSTDCDIESTQTNMVTLIETDLYSDSLATEKVCTIPAGVTVAEFGGGFGYEEGGGNYAIYEIYITPDYEGCTEESVYVRAPEFTYDQSTNYLIPINFVQVP